MKFGTGSIRVRNAYHNGRGGGGGRGARRRPATGRAARGAQHSVVAAGGSRRKVRQREKRILGAGQERTGSTTRGLGFRKAIFGDLPLPVHTLTFYSIVTI